VFGLASFVSPFVFSYLVKALADSTETNAIVSLLAGLTKNNPDWTALYRIFTFIFLLMLLIIYLLSIPVVRLKDDEKTGAAGTYIALLKNKAVLLFFAGIVSYVGTEQALANWMSEFLRTYHGYDPEAEGATAVGWFWG